MVAVAAVVAVDQTVKTVVMQVVPLGTSIPLLPGALSLTHVHNPGVAFSLLPQVPLVVPAVIALTLLVLLFYNEARWARHPPAQWALALLSGGAVGNLIDRIRLGAVVDYIDVHVWPVFNLADAAVTTGAVLLMFALAAARTPYQKARGDR